MAEAEAVLDQVRTTAYTGALTRPTLFVELSPMTHDPLFVARLLHGQATVKAAAVYDFIPLDAPSQYLRDAGQRLDYETRLRWLRRYDLYLPISEATAARLRDAARCCPGRARRDRGAARPRVRRAAAPSGGERAPRARHRWRGAQEPGLRRPRPRALARRCRSAASP